MFRTPGSRANESGARIGRVLPLFAPVGGRLTLQTLTPVMSATQSAKTTIFFTPYQSYWVPIWNGNSFINTPVPEISTTTTDTTRNPAAIGASKVNDWYVWASPSGPRLVHGVDWTSDTARNTTNTMVNGVPLNTTAIVNGPPALRGTWVGTTRSNASSQLNWVLGATDTAGNLAVWNTYNRILATSVVAITGTWSYTSATVRQVNGGAQPLIMQHSFVSGAAEESIEASYYDLFNLLAATTAFADVGLALDSITAFSRFAEPQRVNTAGTLTVGLTVPDGYAPQLGYHYVAALEAGDGSNSTLFIGAPRQSLSFSMRM